MSSTDDAPDESEESSSEPDTLALLAEFDDPADLEPEVVAEVLERGELELVGRLTDASNLSLVARTSADGVRLACVYKPIRGERPLWDFPDGTLAEREYAAAVVARAAGWNCTPPTILRGGPLGTGMVQLWIEGTDSDSAVDLFTPAELPDGWLPVFRAVDEGGHPLVLAHADEPRLALLAAFDLVVNNADRKAGHILPVPDGPLLGVDHGLTMHTEDKLRTVLWGWAGTPLPAEAVEGLDRLHLALADTGELTEELGGLLTQTEVGALRTRVEVLRASSTYNEPPIGRSAIPWPPI
ncbi:SCO1664 family protein [Nakamurella silvestris]|nr:SCO1664 family protein [Nakamurella silvestris]